MNTEINLLFKISLSIKMIHKTLNAGQFNCKTTHPFGPCTVTDASRFFSDNFKYAPCWFLASIHSLAATQFPRQTQSCRRAKVQTDGLCPLALIDTAMIRRKAQNS